MIQQETRGDVSVAPNGLAAGQIVADRYKLDERVGRGGMGEVWAAYDRKLGRRVAVKLVDLDTPDPQGARARFAREAALARQLRGRAFVEVYDQGFFEGRAFIAMELLDGESLLDRLRRAGRLSPAEALSLLRGVADALRLAHTLHIVHRDLKPSNVFFARPKPNSSGVQALDQNREVVKLLDFGVAKDAWDNARLTRPGVLLGSASYMSPEQIQNGYDVDPRSDMWSLGVILYRAVTGQRPFAGSGGEVLAQIVHETAPLASVVNRLLPRAMDGFFGIALAKDRNRRFNTIDEMLCAFASIVEGSPAANDKSSARDSFSALDEIEVEVSSSFGPRDLEDVDPDVFERETIVESIDVKSVFERAAMPQDLRPTDRPGPPPVERPARPPSRRPPPVALAAVDVQDSAPRMAMLPGTRALAKRSPRKEKSRSVLVIFAIAVIAGVAIGAALLSSERFGALVKALRDLFIP